MVEEQGLDNSFKKENFKKENKTLLSFILSKIFFFKTNKNSENKATKSNISSQIDKMIEADMFLFVQQSINNGYKLNKKQSEKFQEKFISEVVKGIYGVSEKTNEVFESGYPLTNEILIKILYRSIRHNSGYINKGIFERMNGKTYKVENKVIPSLRNAFKDKNFFNDFVEKGLDIIKNNDKNSNYLNTDFDGPLHCVNEILSTFVLFLPDLSMNQCLDILNEVEKVKIKAAEYSKKDIMYALLNNHDKTRLDYIKESVDILKKHLKSGFDNEKNSLIKEIKNESLTIEVKNQIKETIKNSNDFDFNELPEKAKILLKELEKNLNKCLKNKEQLSNEESSTVSLIHEKRLSETLVKYLRVDKEYRETLRDINQKNAEDLMMNSLEEFNNILFKCVTNLNIASLKDLSANNRYVNELKKTV